MRDRNVFLSALFGLWLACGGAYAQSAGTMSLHGPSSNPVLPLITPEAIAAAIDAALAAKADTVYGVLTNPSMVGSTTQTLNRTWSGAYPAANPGSYSAQQYTGAPNGGHDDTGGLGVPLNLLQITTDQLAWNPSVGSVAAFEVQHYYGGGAAIGPRTSVVDDCRLNAPILNSGNPAFVCHEIYSTASANVVGAAAGVGGGLGSLWGIDMLYARITSGIYMHQTDAVELGYQPFAGSSMDYSYGIDLINSAPSGYHANAYESALNFSTTGGLWNIGIDFGNPQSVATNGGLPISLTGTAIHFNGGTLGTLLDASLVTADYFLKGPSGFQVLGNNHVVTDQILSHAGTSFSVATNQGNPMVAFGATGASPATYPVISAGASVLIDAGPSAAALALGTQAITSGTTIGRSGAPTTIAGTILSPVNTFTVNTSQGNPLATFGSTTSNPAAYPLLAAGASVLLDAGPSSAALGIGTQSTTSGITIGRTGGTTTIVGSVVVGTFAAVSCPSGITAATAVVLNGILTHC
jgi:hypothetical protein